MNFTPRDPEYAARVATSFAAQSAMQTLQMSLSSVHPGSIVMEFVKSDHVLQRADH